MEASDKIQFSADFERRIRHHLRKDIVQKMDGSFKPLMEARLGGAGVYTTIFVFNGEKNSGEMGPVKNYRIDYDTLRARSWQLLLDSEIAQTVMRKYITWMIGKGLKLQSEPQTIVLKNEGINVDKNEFSKLVESYFELFAGVPETDYSGTDPLNQIEAESWKNAKVGGDVLVILRYEEDGRITIQLIDGSHIQSPLYGTEFWPKELANGNRIENGIELSPRNEHVAYYVRKAGIGFDTERIPAKHEGTGLKMAYLVYGSKFRIDNHRGLPLLAVLFETAKKLDRYKEATVGGAEERQKIAYFFEHQLGSMGDNPLLKQTAIARDVNQFHDGDVPIDTDGNALAERVAATTNKQTFNLGPGSSVKAMAPASEISFKDFYGTNIELFCAAAEIPPEVAMSKYNSNFSASRAALKDWEHTLNVGRDNFRVQFLQPIYNFWLHINILTNRISAPGYLQAALMDKNPMVVAAYRKCRFIGASVPHIDPLKEVMAEREKLGPAGANMPLTTLEQATEVLNGGDSEANMEQFAAELEKNNDLEIIPVPEPIAPTPAPPGGATS